MRTQVIRVGGEVIGRSRVRRRTRCGKAGYAKRKDAAAAAKRSTRASGELIAAYHCPHGCHCWHIGHPPGTRPSTRPTNKRAGTPSMAALEEWAAAARARVA